VAARKFPASVAGVGLVDFGPLHFNTSRAQSGEVAAYGKLGFGRAARIASVYDWGSISV
jgi:hypothetical protein